MLFGVWDCCQRYWTMLTVVRPKTSSAASTITTRQRQRHNARIGPAYRGMGTGRRMPSGRGFGRVGPVIGGIAGQGEPMSNVGITHGEYAVHDADHKSDVDSRWGSEAIACSTSCFKTSRPLE